MLNLKFYLITIFLVVSCFQGEDPLEFRGFGTDGSFETNNRSLVTSLSVNDDQLIIEGEDLDLIGDLVLFSDANPNALAIDADIWVRELRIVSQTPTRIIATGSTSNVDLYFDGNYDLIRRDINSPVEDVFPFTVKRMEVGILEEEKINDEIILEPKHILHPSNDREVITYSEELEKWSTGVITGQLEYIGAWDTINNQTWSPALRNVSVELNETGTNQFIPSPGQYYVIQRDCYVYIDDIETPEAAADPTIVCPFGGTSADPLIVENRLAYRAGDWVVYDGTKWHYISNRGEVESFNGRRGIIEACPNPSCPNQYDYTWAMINKVNSKLADIEDVPTPSIINDGFVIKVRDGEFVLDEDNLGLSEVRSSDIENETLINEDFAPGIEIQKFNGLQEELDSYVDKVPLSGVASVTGDINFENSHLSGVSEIETSTGNFSPVEMKATLDAQNLASKLGTIEVTDLDPSKKYYLSSDNLNNLVWKELNTTNLIEGASNFLLLC